MESPKSWLLTPPPRPVPSHPAAPGPRSYTTLRDEAVKLFNSLQQLESQRDPVPLIQGILQTCLDLPPLVDEIYCQLVKQTTEPPAPGGPGDLHYWQLLTCMSCTFLPSPPVLRFLRFHLDRRVPRSSPGSHRDWCGVPGTAVTPPPPLLTLVSPPAGRRSRFPASEMAKYACFIREALGKTRGRECVPSLEEILVLMRRQEMVCTVHCPGAAACSVAISSHTTAEEVRAKPVPCAGLGSIGQRGRGRGGNLGDAGTPASARRDLSVSLCSPERRGQGRAVTVGCLCLAPGGPGAGVAPGAVPEPQPLCALRAVPAPGAARGQLHAAG